MKWLIAVVLATVGITGCTTPGGYPYGYPPQPYGANPYGQPAPYTPPPPGAYVPPNPAAIPQPGAPTYTPPPAAYQPPAIPSLSTPAVTIPPPPTGSIGAPAGIAPSFGPTPRIAPPPAATSSTGASLQAVPSLASPPPAADNRTSNSNNNPYLPPVAGVSSRSGSVATPQARADWPPQTGLQPAGDLAWGTRSTAVGQIYPHAAYVSPATYDADPYFSSPVRPSSVRSGGVVIADEACCGPPTYISPGVPIVVGGYDSSGGGYDVSGYSSPSYTANGWRPRTNERR